VSPLLGDVGWPKDDALREEGKADMKIYIPPNKA